MADALKPNSRPGCNESPEQVAACHNAVTRCRPTCALEVIAGLLSTPGAVSGEQADLLLDLHQLLKHRREPEAALRAFCELRRALELRHYLAFYRLRRWLENHISVEIRPVEGDARITLPLQLKFYCVEAVRRCCLCAALEQGVFVQYPRLSFAFTEPQAA